MKKTGKKDFPVPKIREYLEPGPVLLVSSRWKGQDNIMTMGWHTVMEFSPSLVGCIISSENHSFEMVRKSKQCVLNLPSSALAKTVIGIGNCSGRGVDKFEKFKLTAEEASEIDAPLIKECHSNFECRLVDSKFVNKYNFFVFEVVRAHVTATPRYPETLHYRGKGLFMLSGRTLRIPSKV